MARLLVSVAKLVPNIPFYYYHYPNINGANVNVKLVLDMANKMAPNIIGCKFTCNKFNELNNLVSSGYNVLCGADNMLLPALAAGADGAIGLTYNFSGLLHN